MNGQVGKFKFINVKLLSNAAETAQRNDSLEESIMCELDKVFLSSPPPPIVAVDSPEEGGKDVSRWGRRQRAAPQLLDGSEEDILEPNSDETTLRSKKWVCQEECGTTVTDLLREINLQVSDFPSRTVVCE